MFSESAVVKFSSMPLHERKCKGWLRISSQWPCLWVGQSTHLSFLRSSAVTAEVAFKKSSERQSQTWSDSIQYLNSSQHRRQITSIFSIFWVRDNDNLFWSYLSGVISLGYDIHGSKLLYNRYVKFYFLKHHSWTEKYLKKIDIFASKMGERGCV